MTELYVELPMVMNVNVTSRCGSDIEFTQEESSDPFDINITINDYLSTPEEIEMIHELSAKGYYTPQQVSELDMRGTSKEYLVGKYLTTLSKKDLATLITAAAELLADENLPF